MRRRLRETLLRRRPGYPYSTGRTLAIYAALMVTILLAALDQTIIATALPAVVSDIGGLSSYPWVFSVFLICQTVTVPIWGRLGDIYGRRRLFFVSIPIFLAGSALCGIAQAMPELIVFRGIQGIGAGGVIPLAMATTGEIVPPRDRGRYVALITAAFTTAAVLGPLAGGLIVDNTSWRWIFYFNLPIGALALAVIALTMPARERHAGHRVDYVGAGLLAAATTSLLLVLLGGGQAFPWVSPQIAAAGAATVLVSTVFVIRMRRVPHGILPLDVVGDRIVATGAFATGVSVACMFGAIVFVPLFAQGALGFSATQAGLMLIPQALGGGAAMILTGLWIARTGRYRGSALLGPVLLAGGMVLLATMDVETTRTEVAVSMVVVGLGTGSMTQALMLAAQSAVPIGSIGAATSLLQFARAIGTTIGVAAFGAIVNHGLPEELRGRGTIVNGLSRTGQVALADALEPAFVLGAVACGVVFAVVWLGLEQRPLRATIDDAVPASVTAMTPE